MVGKDLKPYSVFKKVKSAHFTVCHLALFTLQTIGSEEILGLAYSGVIKYYGWKKVTILQLDIDLFETVRPFAFF